jgi:hypothetical protein
VRSDLVRYRERRREFAQESKPHMTITAQRISKMSPSQVDGLFHTGEVGPIPEGDAEGTAIFRPGSPAEPFLRAIVRRIAWQGKVVSARDRSLKNKILPIGVRAIEADVYPASSWFDGRECIVLDYSRRSLLARAVRDEIRRVAPGLYLGLVYLGKTRLIYFTLQFAS